MIENLNIRDERAGRGKSTRRQTVLAGRKGSVHADFIEASGLVPTIKASSVDPVIATIAGGYNKFGTVDKIIELTEDVSYPSIQSNATTFLGVDEDKNLVTSLLPPVYGSVFSSDRENKINASFNGDNGDTEFVDEYGNHFRAYGTGWQISNVNQYSGMNTLRCNGGESTTNRWEVLPANLDNRSLDQWTVELFFRPDSTTSGVYQHIFNIGEVPGQGMAVTLHPSGNLWLWVSSDESSYNVLNNINPNNTGSYLMSDAANRGGVFGSIPATGILQNAAWYHFAMVFDGLSYRFYLNGYLVLSYSGQYNYSEIFNLLKTIKANKIWLGAGVVTGITIGKFTGNISNFAFHPYAKYQTKKYVAAGDLAAVRDIFTPPSVPLSLITQSDRYYQESEAIYLDFESANATIGNHNTVPDPDYSGDVFTKDLYGRNLIAFGNDNSTLTRGAYIKNDPAGAKFGNNYLNFSGVAAYNNAAYIKAPVWADKWTVELWGMDNLLTAPNKTYIDLVTPNDLGNSGFFISSDGDGSQIRFHISLGTTGSSSDILNFNSSYSYSNALYNHIAVSYDGVTYRFFVNGSLVTSVVSQLRVVNASHFIFGRVASNTYFLNGKIDDFAYVPYCKYIGAFTPPATALLSSMPEQYVFDTKKTQMYKGYPTAFTADNSLFVGEALTSINKVEKVITYALNGEYRERFSTDFITAAFLGYAQTRRHNLGIGGIVGVVKAITNSGSVSGRTGELVDIQTLYNGANYSFNPYSSIDRNIYGIHSGPNGFVTLGPTGAGVGIDGGTGQEKIDLVVEAKRSF